MTRSSCTTGVRRAALAAALVVLGSAPSALSAQASSPAAVAAPASVLAVGDVAPDFALPGATRYGRLLGPVRLADLKGQTIVIAFFYKARTKG